MDFALWLSDATLREIHALLGVLALELVSRGEPGGADCFAAQRRLAYRLAARSAERAAEQFPPESKPPS
jgi:hypothetical protein